MLRLPCRTTANSTASTLAATMLLISQCSRNQALRASIEYRLATPAPGGHNSGLGYRTEIALGLSYETVGFRDVMVRSLVSPARHIAWRHPNTYSSVFAVVDAGSRISDGALLSGSIQNLDYDAYPDPTYHVDMPGIKYGFFGHDYYYNVAGGIVGHALNHGHAGGVVSVSRFSDSHAASHEINFITDWSFGGGYYDLSGSANSRNINAHYWGAGNSYTADFNPHGLFVR